jgi:serine/threonine protein kinase
MAVQAVTLKLGTLKMPVPRYELQGLLGEGGMGVVYCALDTRTNSLVALKTLRDVSDPATLEMFKREWEELRNLIHANIVDLRDVDEVEIDGVRRPCFIMPLLPGETLASLIKASSPRLTTEFVVNTIFQVCKGLQFAHEKSLIHRDLKPSNIFIMSDDTAKIIDFGLVHAAGNKSVSGLKGTWQYMSPEQIDGKPPTPSFDIYSLGVVAYEALTGHQPFKRGRFDDTVDAVRHFIPQAISERNSKVPQLVSKAIHLAMAKQAIRRYTSAKEFADTLQKAYNNQPIDRFDPAKIRPRIDRAKRAFSSGDSDFATEILSELEAEGNLDPEITLLRSQIDEFSRQKKVRQLFEAAQTRIEQDEIPLAQEKLEEILRIDPQNIDAQKMRRRIGDQLSQQQVASCLSLARQHLELHDFAEARRNLKEVFNLKYDEPEAAQLQDEIDAREKEVASARSEKEHLYSSAVRAQQTGEISSVLSKLEKIFEVSRGVPGASVPERDKVYQAFYSEMRIESDRVDNAFAEGTRHLAEKNFEKALEFCDSVLARYPKHQKFQALRLKIEHSRRQELSAYIAEIGRAADAEPNLDRRVALLDEASKRYPSEGQFSRQLSLARDLRELVDSIVNRARNYDEQSQFDEAIAQWNTVANVHPQYPGIDFEISQLERRREQQAETDKKSRLVQKIDRALDSSAYAEAERLSQEGLLEFPNNQELLALLKTSRQRM